MELATDVVARTATAKEVTAGHRLYGLTGPGGPAPVDLAYAYDMAAMGQGLQPHLSAQLKRVSLNGPAIRTGVEPGQGKSPGGSGMAPLAPNRGRLDKVGQPGDSMTARFSRPPPPWTRGRRDGGSRGARPPGHGCAMP